MTAVSEAFLLRRAQAGDTRAAGALIDRYTGMLTTIARDLFAPGLTFDDLLQEARIGAMKAIRDYDHGRSGAAPVGAFMYECARRQVITAVVFARRRKFELLNGAAPLDAPHGPDDLTLAEALPDVSPGAHEQLVQRQELGRLVTLARRELSDLEREALADRLNGRSYAETAARLGTDTKGVDNALQRVRRRAMNALAA